jgi:UDP-glucose 4-epimerase
VQRVLITGVAGGQGSLVAKKLMGRAEVIGVDRDPWLGRPRSVPFHQLDLRKRKFEDLIRHERPDTLIHLAFVRHFRGDPGLRHEINVTGTKRLLEYAASYGVKKLLIFSSSYVYGALPDNAFYLDEDAPLQVSRNYPEVRDLAEVDTLASAFLWRRPEVSTTILRPANVLGRHVHSAIGHYLRLQWVPTIIGFNPMMQFIHEEDVADAIVLAVEKGARGVFNLVGPSAVPLSVAIDETGGVAMPLPELLARPAITALFRFGLYSFPAGAIDFVKYPCTIDGTLFRQATGFTPRFELDDIFASVAHGSV